MPVGKFTSDIRTKYSEVLGPDCGPLYIRLVEEVIWLHVKWREYSSLYAKSEERVALLNNAAGFFFRIIHDVLWEDVFLHIARLTDNILTNSKDNLTIKRLSSIVDRNLSDEVTGLIDSAAKNSEFARDWRNRHLAHRDLNLALDLPCRPLPPVSRMQVEEALASLCAVLNRIEDFYFKAERDFHTFLANGDANDLVYCINTAQIASERLRKRFQEGKPLPEDYERPPDI